MSVQVLLFKSLPDDSLEDEYSDLPHKIYYVPVLRTQFVNVERLSDISTETQPINLVFTSTRAVQAYNRIASNNRRRRLFVVGPATKRALLRLRPELAPCKCETVLGEETGNAAALADFIKRLDNNERDVDFPTDSKYLYLTGDKNSPAFSNTLRQAGKEVEQLQVYSTTGDPSLVSSALQSIKMEGEYILAVLFSPSSAQTVLPILQKSMTSIFIAAIGETTRRFLEEEAKVVVHVTASEPTSEGLKRAIEAWLASRSTGGSL